MRKQAPIPLRELSFQAYWSNDRLVGRTYFASIVHFYVAQKFRTTSADVFRSVMDSTSLKEIRKISKRNESLCRDDWVGVRGRVLVCAMCYAYWSDPNPERWQGDPEALSMEMAELGFPLKFCAAAVAEFHRLQANARWIFLGIDHAPPDALGKRINALHRKYKRAWTIHFWVGRHTNWRLHDWAVEQLIPIRYFGQLHERMTNETTAALVRGASNTCIFEQRGGKAMDSVIRLVRGLKSPLEMEFFTTSPDTPI